MAVVFSMSSGGCSGSMSIQVTVNAPGAASPAGLDPVGVAEADHAVDVVRRDVRLQAELAEHGGGVEVADHRANLVGVGGVGEEVGAGEVDGATGGGTPGERAGVGALHAPLRARGVAVGGDPHRYEVHVGEPFVHACDVGGERVAEERPAGGRVLVGAALGEGVDHLLGFVAVPRVEVALECGVDAHAKPFAARRPLDHLVACIPDP